MAAIPNSAATGEPTISGTVQVGQTLTASTSDISDSNGPGQRDLHLPVDSKRWDRRHGYPRTRLVLPTLWRPQTKGKTIKVQVSFTDDGGNQETRTSDVTVAVAAAPSPTPLTAATHDEPGSHNGQDAFKFELRSVRSWDGLQLQDAAGPRVHGDGRRGGRGPAAGRGQRHPQHQVGVSVTPDSNADVTVELPATEDCDAQGAICNRDRQGRCPAR